MKKSDRHNAIRARYSCAVAAMYHNATPRYPTIDDPKTGERFQAWFEDAAMAEIDYINDGGAYAPTEGAFRRIVEKSAERKYTSEAARRRYVNRGMASMREERATDAAAWERINEWGTVYQWGRGGRTLAPDGLVRDGGGGCRMINWRGDPRDLTIAQAVDAIRVFESFNAYVKSWCDSVPEMWEEYERERIAEERAERERRVAVLDAHYRGL